MAIELSLIWAGIIAFAIFAYVALDGFDLGVGILFPSFREDHHKDLAMNTIAPFWDGNETWLVLGGGGLFAVFPLAYATALPALYAPLIAMLVGLIFRGVAFEFRWRSTQLKPLWDLAFTGGSVIAAFAQGVALGALIQGIEIEDRAYVGGNWDWLTPFSILTGVALVVGYTLLGATWLIMKTQGVVQYQARRVAWWTGALTLVLIGLVSLITPFLHPVYLERWFTGPTIAYSAIVPFLMLGASYALYRGLYDYRDVLPFIATLAIFLLCFIGLGISFYPNMVPPDLSIRDAAAPDNSLQFLLIGAVVLIPLILAYTLYSYWVFRGKVDPDAGYH